MPEAEIDIGTSIDNRYRIERVLGQGGFGRTYLASDNQRFGELCVLKEFVPSSRAEYTVQKSRALFEREALVLYQINHPQIPKFLACFSQMGRLFLVQEYIDGKTYSDLLRERQQQGKLFSEAEVLQWLKDLLPVLTYLHEGNLVHRDISPDNVMLPNGQSRPMLIDFGLVKQTVSQLWAVNPHGSSGSDQSFVGKFGYAPPEQIRLGQCYPCSDLYALGVTAVVLLTGLEPNLLMDRRCLEWQWHDKVKIRDDLAKILDKMMAEKPQARYQSAEEVLADLHALALPGAIAVPTPRSDLHIEIDTASLERQVAEIEEMDYFQQLLKEAELLRNSIETNPEIQPKAATPPKLKPAFIDRCRQELARLLPNSSRLQTVLLLSAIVTALVMGVRQLGMLEALELAAFDQLLRLRPDEGPDPRLLVVSVTEADIQAQKQWPLSDRTLAQVLQKLEPHQPRAIGVDIYRDLPTGPGDADLAPHLLNPHLIAVCEVSEVNKIGIPPPPEIPRNRLGFSDVVVDADGILRRHLLFMTPDPTSPCTTTNALSLQLALHYLAAEGIQPKLTPKEFLQLGATVFKPLEADTGGYRQLDARGYQVLLNYRSPQNVAEQVTLSEVLTDRFNPSQVKDRIVLIGVTAASVHDDFSTPYSAGQWPYQKLPGVLVQAQMVSQILSAVLDRRPLLSVWPSWGEVLWVWGWSLVGGVFAWGNRRPLLLRLGLVGGAVVTLYGLCFVLLIQGGWVPLVPSALALVATGGSVVVVYTASPTQRQQ